LGGGALKVKNSEFVDPVSELKYFNTSIFQPGGQEAEPGKVLDYEPTNF
jgi:hypothetical protein